MSPSADQNECQSLLDAWFGQMVIIGNAYPPASLSTLHNVVCQAIAKHPRLAEKGQRERYLTHVRALHEEVATLVRLLPVDAPLNGREAFDLAISAYVYALGRDPLLPEPAAVFREWLAAGDRIDLARPPWTCSPGYDGLLLVIEEVIEEVKRLQYDGIQLPQSVIQNDVEEVCSTVLNASWDNAMIEHDRGPVRTALLAAILTLADLLVLVTSKSIDEAAGLDSAAGSDDPPRDIDTFRHLHTHFQGIRREKGHLYLVYRVASDDDGKLVKALSYGPTKGHFRAVESVLSQHGFDVWLDAEIIVVQQGQVSRITDRVRAHAEKMVAQRLTKLLLVMGKPSKQGFTHHLSALRPQAKLRWPGTEAADSYKCEVTDPQNQKRDIFSVDTPEVTLPEVYGQPSVHYEWKVVGYQGTQRMPYQERGVYWLLDTQSTHWVEQQLVWYAQDKAMQARILANHGLYEDAIVLYRGLVEDGNEIHRSHARVHLLALYWEISQQWDRLWNQMQTRWYSDAADAYRSAARALL